MYHINSSGVPKKCNRDPDNCKLGGPEEHFSTQEEAQRYANSLMSERFSIIPDVENISADIPSDNVLKVMNYKYSELYSSVMFIKDKTHVPILFLGVDNKGSKVYQFFSFNENVYYDINGIVASNKDLLKEHVINKYSIVDSLKTIDYPESLRMIEILTSVDIDSYSAGLALEEHIQKIINNSSGYEKEALEYIYKELN